MLQKFKKIAMENYQKDLSMATIGSAQAISFTDPEKVLYTAKTHTTGGRDGASLSSDGRLDIKHSTPGKPGNGTNPEQLFAAGWSACFIGAMGIGALQMKVKLPPNTAIDAEVDLCNIDGSYFLQARLNISIPGLDREVAHALVEFGEENCPYSKATRGNIATKFILV